MIYDLRFTIAAPAGFSPGSSIRAALNRFNGFSSCEKPLKRLGVLLRRHTGLKPGVNESLRYVEVLR